MEPANDGGILLRGGGGGSGMGGLENPLEDDISLWRYAEEGVWGPVVTPQCLNS